MVTDSFWIRLTILCLIGAVALQRARAEVRLDAITFACEPGTLYVPMDAALRALRWKAQRDDAGKCVSIHGTRLPTPARELLDGTELVALSALESAGASAYHDGTAAIVTVRAGGRGFALSPGPKHVEVSLREQKLRAWEGSRLVLETRISSGKHGSTPAGEFRAGPFRARMHYSTRYHHAPMPWSVQIHGHIFIHGFTQVPSFPASHGCIRLPLDGRNPAKFFYEWVDDGCPVRVVRD